MSSSAIHALPGGLALSAPMDAHIDATIHELDLQPSYYLPLINYSRTVLHPEVKSGDCVLGGEQLAPGVVAPTSGTLTEIRQHPWPHPSHTQVPTLVLESDGRDEFQQFTVIDHTQVGVEEILNRLENSAIHGLGGAAFNTANKIRRAYEHKNLTLIINAVECEPGINCDDALMQQHPSEVLQACNAIRQWLRLPSAVLAIENDKQTAITALRDDQTPDLTSIKITELPTIYPSGAESPLVQRLTGIKLQPGERATDAGVLCLNVATVLSIHDALMGQAAVDRIVSISTQSLQHSMNLRVRFGTPLKAVIEFAREHNTAIEAAWRSNTQTIRIGGPLSGFAMDMLNAPVLASTNALIVGKEHPLNEATACIRCSECATVCPVNLLPQELYAAAASEQLDTAARYSLDACLLCGCCDLVCPASIPLTPWFRFAKDATRQKQQSDAAAEVARLLSEKHSNRVQRRAIEKEQQEAARRAAAAQRQNSAQDIKAALTRVKNKRPGSGS